MENLPVPVIALIFFFALVGLAVVLGFVGWFLRELYKEHNSEKKKREVLFDRIKRTYNYSSYLVREDYESEKDYLYKVIEYLYIRENPTNNP